MVKRSNELNEQQKSWNFLATLFYIVCLVGLAYLLILIPRIQTTIPAKPEKRDRRSIKRVVRNILFALKDWEFVKSLAYQVRRPS